MSRSRLSIAKDVPSSELFSPPFEQWRDVFLGPPGKSPESIWVALDADQPIGLAALRRQGGNSAWHEGTGVERPYRGRGVARLLKIRTIEWARENGIDFLYTGNDINNPRMYDINIRLGYSPLPSRIEVVKVLRS